MKICMVNTLYAPTEMGGAERSVRVLAEGLAKRGHELAVICIGEEDANYDWNGISVHRIQVPNLYWPFSDVTRSMPAKMLWHATDSFNPWALIELIGIIRAISPDVIHTNNLFGMSVSAWSAARHLGVPIVHTLRDYYLECSKCTKLRGTVTCNKQCVRCRVFTTPRRVLSKSCGSVVGISKFILASHVEAGYFEGVRPHVVYNAVATHIAENTAVRVRRASELVVGYIGRLDRTKGIEVAIDALRSVSGLDVRLLVAGTGENSYESHLRQRAQGLNVDFLGHVPAETFMPRIDVLVVPSLWDEPMGRVVAEGFIHGRPAIVSKRGGLPELVRENETGYIVEPTAAELARCFTLLLESPGLLARMSAATVSKAPEFVEEGVVTKYEEIFEEAKSVRVY